MAVTAAMVKELRGKTGAGMLDCKKALIETNGDVSTAVDYLRKKSLASAEKKAGRIAAEGLVGSYIHTGGRIGVLVEVNCETDFVARSTEFQAFVRDVGMQVAAARPTYVRRDDVPESVIKREREIYQAQAAEMGKPEKVLERIVDGRMEKFFAENCLVEQPFVKDPDKKIGDVATGLTGRIGEKISIRRFARFELGEGMEKRSDDFAAEVAAQVGGVQS